MLHINLSIHLSVHQHLILLIRLSIYLSDYMFNYVFCFKYIHTSIDPCIYLYLLIYPTSYPYINLFIYLSTNPFHLVHLSRLLLIHLYNIFYISFFYLPLCPVQLSNQLLYIYPYSNLYLYQPNYLSS